MFMECKKDHKNIHVNDSVYLVVRTNSRYMRIYPVNFYVYTFSISSSLNGLQGFSISYNVCTVCTKPMDMQWTDSFDTNSPYMNSDEREIWCSASLCLQIADMNYFCDFVRDVFLHGYKRR